ncbi:MAG: DUF389 domain-containing protein [Chitinispirillaceae bacterium]|nr:DUF389 domain-containing protein [Chitinispirillaceae bacterium]
MSRDGRKQNKQNFQGDIEPQAKLNQTYIILMAVSGTLAAVAFLTNSIPILIGSMVIAPVMPPLILIAIGIANKQFNSVVKGFMIVTVGLIIALFCTMVTTWLLLITGINPNLILSQMLTERVTTGWYSVVAAFAAGTAGAIAVSHNKQDTLVGVVASIALVPTVAGAGIAAITGDWESVKGGLVMLAINTGMIVFMGFIVFNFFSENDR